MKIWANSKKPWKHSPVARVPTAFLVLPYRNTVHVFYFLNKIHYLSIEKKLSCHSDSFVLDTMEMTKSSENSVLITSELMLILHLACKVEM